jgi:hypothetical protein
MNNMPDTTTVRKPLWRRIVKWSIRVLLTMAVLIIVIHSSWNYLAGRNLNREIDRIQAAGEPVTFHDLEASQAAIDPANDAGPYYAAAMEFLRHRFTEKAKEIEVDFYKIVRDGILPSPQLLMDATQLLEENRIALELLDKGRDLPDCIFDFGLDYGISVMTDRIFPALTTAKMNSLRTRLLAFQGKGDEASQSALSSSGMLRMFERQPLPICHLVRISCMSLFVADIPIILEFGHPSEEAMQKLEKALAEAEQRINFKRIWIAERVCCLETMKNLIPRLHNPKTKWQDNLPYRERYPNNFILSPLMRSMVVDLFRHYAKVIDVSEKPWPDVLEAMKKLNEQDRRWLLLGGLWKISGTAYEHTTVRTVRSIAKLRSALAAMMIERYRRSKGVLPENLVEMEMALAQTLPSDPFTGQSLIYRQTSGGYEIYSVGDDRKDDGKPSGSEDEHPWGIRVRIQP